MRVEARCAVLDSCIDHVSSFLVSRDVLEFEYGKFVMGAAFLKLGFFFAKMSYLEAS